MDKPPPEVFLLHTPKTSKKFRYYNHLNFLRAFIKRTGYRDTENYSVHRYILDPDWKDSE